MSDAPRPTEPLTLTEPFELEHNLARIVPDLRRIKRRKALMRASVFREHAAEIERVTYGLAYGRPVVSAPRPERRFLRIVAWNVERGRELAGIRPYLQNHPQLREADVLLLPEVDIGMARSGNRNIAKEIAEVLGFEWVFGNSYLCLSRGNPRDGEPDEENTLGLHGNAVLSRYPIRRVENVSACITKDKFQSSEKRLGHKKTLWAEIDTPLGTLPVAVAHLDSGASPAQRAAQLRDLLNTLAARGFKERAIVGGDFNTTTYDLKSVPRLLWNVFMKLLRGGFPHALHHYVHPYKLYEKVIFDELEKHGFQYKPFNAPGMGTSRYEVGTFASESQVRDYLPQPAVWALKIGLAPWNGVAPLKIDWITAKGVRPLSVREMEDVDGRMSLSPVSWEKPTWNGRLLSDHDPVVADVVL